MGDLNAKVGKVVVGMWLAVLDSMIGMQEEINGWDGVKWFAIQICCVESLF